MTPRIGGGATQSIAGVRATLIRKANPQNAKMSTNGGREEARELERTCRISPYPVESNEPRRLIPQVAVRRSSDSESSLSRIASVPRVSTSSFWLARRHDSRRKAEECIYWSLQRRGLLRDITIYIQHQGERHRDMHVRVEVARSHILSRARQAEYRHPLVFGLSTIHRLMQVWLSRPQYEV